MFDRVLTTIRAEENKVYVDRFGKLVKASPLTLKRVKELLDKKPILGYLTQRDIKGYENILSFEILKKLEKPDDSASCLEVNHLAGKYGLGIGEKDNDLEIIQLRHPGCYFIRELPLSIDGEYKWVEVPKEFRLETHELLPSRLKNRFRCLKE